MRASGESCAPYVISRCGSIHGMRITAKWDRSALAGLEPGPMRRATVAALRKAGVTALRDMRSEASKRIRQRKRIKAAYIGRALTMRRPRGGDLATMEWALDVSGAPVPLIAYPHRAVRGRTGRRGMGPRSLGGQSVEVNRGKRTTVRGAFVAVMRSGHTGIFRRVGPERLPIRELLGSRPVDALLHQGEAEAVAARGGSSMAETFARLLPIEIKATSKAAE